MKTWLHYAQRGNVFDRRKNAVSIVSFVHIWEWCFRWILLDTSCDRTENLDDAIIARRVSWCFKTVDLLSTSLSPDTCCRALFCVCPGSPCSMLVVLTRCLWDENIQRVALFLEVTRSSDEAQATQVGPLRWSKGCCGNRGLQLRTSSGMPCDRRHRFRCQPLHRQGAVH